MMERHYVGLSQSGSDSFGMPTSFAEWFRLGIQHFAGTHSPGGGHPRCLSLVLVMSPIGGSFHLDRRRRKTSTESDRKLPPGNCLEVSHLHS